MKRQLTIIVLMLASLLAANAQEYRKDRLFMPRGSLGVGAQVSYMDLGSSDSDILMILQNMNASGSLFSIEPFFLYAYKDNKAIGAKFKYSKTEGQVSSADLKMFSDDLNMSVENISADSRSFQMQIFKRSYLGLDKKGRFGLFNDLALSYANTRSSFAYNEETLDAYSLSKKVKLGINPGIVIFILNNVSTQVSMSIGGVSYTHTDCYEHGERTGTRDYTRANFAPDVIDISFGMTLYL